MRLAVTTVIVMLTHTALFPLRANVQTWHAEIETEQCSGFSSSHIKLAKVRAPEGAMARRQVSPGITADESSARVQNLDLEHPIMSYVELSRRVKTDAVRLIINLFTLLGGQIGQDL